MLNPDDADIRRIVSGPTDSIPLDAPANIAVHNTSRYLLITNHALLSGNIDHFAILKPYVDDIESPLVSPPKFLDLVGEPPLIGMGRTKLASSFQEQCLVFLSPALFTMGVIGSLALAPFFKRAASCSIDRPIDYHDLLF